MLTRIANRIKTYKFVKEPPVRIHGCTQEEIWHLRKKFNGRHLTAWVDFNELAERAMKKKVRSIIHFI